MRVTRIVCWASVGLGCLLTAAYLVVAVSNHTEWVPNALYFVPAGLAAFVLWIRVATVAEDRIAWSLLAIGLTVWVGGDAWETYVTDDTSRILSMDNAMYTAGYVGLMVGVSLAASQRRVEGSAIGWLAGYVAGLAAAALVVGVMLDGVAVEAETVGSFLESTWFIVLAVVTIAVVTVRLSAAGWYPGWQLGVLCTAVALNATADLFYLSPLSSRGVVLVSAMDVAWLVSFTLFAVAAMLPVDPDRRTQTVTWRDGWIPNSWLLLALVIVVIDALGVEIPVASTLLATFALALGGIRAAIIFGEHVRLLEQMRTEARHDHLTGLPNRRALMEELPTAIADTPRLRLVILDLNGFKLYNDTRGHQEGDLLLKRLADRLARVVDGRGRAYRLGGDEFCVIWPLDASLQVRDVEHALSEPSSRTPISAACGEVEIPIEAHDVDAALRMADARMYARKVEQRDAVDAP